MSGWVSVLALGGTISMTGEAGVTPTLGAEELIAQVPSLADGPELRARSVFTKPGADITIADLDGVAAQIRSDVADGAVGAVVVQGTDTIEETAFALDLLLGVEEPVVVTGAMRNPTLPGADGPANINAAVRTAAVQSARNLGVMVLLNDTIHAAARVQKRHSSMMDAFRSDPHGAIGWFQEGLPVIVDRTRVRFPELGPPQRNVRVPLLPVALDLDSDTLEAVAGSGIDALVVEAFGVGHVSGRLAGRLVELASDLPVVLSTRTRGGAVHQRTYGFVGSEQYLLDGGLISAGWLDSIKARLLTLMTLRSGGAAADLDVAFGVVRPD